ncbi:MAG: hypothetical protein ACFE9N_11445 [Promethearchaeota archaeon]
MESKLQSLSAFQIYSTGTTDRISIMVDHLWIKDNKVFFRVIEGTPPIKTYFRKERELNVFSICKEDLLSIRCRLYF